MLHDKKKTVKTDTHTTLDYHFIGLLLALIQIHSAQKWCDLFCRCLILVSGGIVLQWAQIWEVLYLAQVVFIEYKMNRELINAIKTHFEQ